MAAERSPPRRVCGYRQTMPRAPVPLLDREGFDLPRAPPWHQSDVAPIAYGFAIVFMRSFCLHRYVCEALTCYVPRAAQDRLLPPRAGIAGRLRAHPTCLACSSASRPSRNKSASVVTRSCLNSGSIRCLISRSEAAHSASVSSTDAVRTHDLQISVAHGFMEAS